MCLLVCRLMLYCKHFHSCLHVERAQIQYHQPLSILKVYLQSFHHREREKNRPRLGQVCCAVNHVVEGIVPLTKWLYVTQFSGVGEGEARGANASPLFRKWGWEGIAPLLFYIYDVVANRVFEKKT